MFKLNTNINIILPLAFGKISLVMFFPENYDNYESNILVKCG